MRACQKHRWRTTRIERLFPAGGAEAPAVAWLEAREAGLVMRRAEIVALGSAELEKLLIHSRADDVSADIRVVRIAATVTKEPGFGAMTARLDRPPHDAEADRRGARRGGFFA